MSVVKRSGLGTHDSDAGLYTAKVPDFMLWENRKNVNSSEVRGRHDLLLIFCGAKRVPSKTPTGYCPADV